MAILPRNLVGMAKPWFALRIVGCGNDIESIFFSIFSEYRSHAVSAWPAYLRLL